MKKILVLGIVFIIGSFNTFSIIGSKHSDAVFFNLYFNQGFLNIDNTFTYNNNKFKVDEYVTSHDVGFRYENFFKTYKELNEESILIGYFAGFTFNSYNFVSQDLIMPNGINKLDVKINSYNFLIGADFHIESLQYYFKTAIKLSYFDSEESIIKNKNSDFLPNNLQKIEVLQNYYFSEFHSSINIGIGSRIVYLSGAAGINIELNYEHGLMSNGNLLSKRLNLGIIYDLEL